MPLFGSSKKHHDTATSGMTNTGRHGVAAPAGAAGTANLDSAPMGTGRHGEAPMVGNNVGNAPMAQQGLGQPQAAGYAGNNFEHGAGPQGAFNQPTSGINDPYGAAGVGHGNNLPPNNNLPPTGALNNSHGSSGGTGSRLTGKVESAVGSMIGSNALKAKGLQKEQEANAMKVQGQELAEAERLEREAMMRRERAVAHGAHPDNKHLGAGMTNMDGSAARGPGRYN